MFDHLFVNLSQQVVIPLWVIGVIVAFSITNAVAHLYQFIRSHRKGVPTPASLRRFTTQEVASIQNYARRLTIKRMVQLVSVFIVVLAITLLVMDKIETETALILLASPLPLATLAM